MNELEQAIKDYIHFYNYERTKSKLSIKSINLDHNSLS
ncbi:MULTISPECIES: IS3 family transposase [Lactobacillus]|nr:MULTISPECIES: IS3 family transposase [Lactobacillus]